MVIFNKDSMVHKISLYVILIFLFLCTNATSESSQKKVIQNHIDAGIKYGQQGKIEKAIIEFKEILAIAPDNVDAFNNLGVAYFQLKDYKKSLFYQTKAVELNPSDPRIYFNRGLLFGKYMYEDEKAIADYTQAIQLYPKYTRAYLNRGLAYYFLRKYDKAVGDFNKVEQLNPKSAKNIISFRANAYFELEQFTKAFDDIKKAEALGEKLDQDLILKVNNALNK